MLKTTPPEAVTISLRDVTALSALLDGGDTAAVRVYFHILQNGGTLDESRAAETLGLSPRELDAASARLVRAGLLVPGGSELPAPPREMPEYQARDVVRRTMEDKQFRQLVEAVQMTLGHILSSTDLKKLFGIYDELALPADVILMLVQYCKEEYRRRYGEGKNVGFTFIVKEANDWFEREIMTYDQAEQWLRERERRRSLMGQLQRALGIRDRALSATERQYLERWIDLGFGPEAIAEAADRTVTNTGGLKWKYMDSIVRSWDRMGLHTPEEIAKGDKKPRKAEKTAPAAPARDDAKTLEQLDRLREKMKQS